MIIGVCLALATATAVADRPMAGLRVDGTAFVLTSAGGVERRGADLVGAELDIGDGSTLRIDGMRVDPHDPTGEIWLHRFSRRVGDGEWQNPCGADREGHQEGLPIAGRWGADGRFHADDAHFALSCTGGAQVKCVRFGYKPWKQAVDGTPLLPSYEACVRMVRADYCGDGHATTREGMAIDIFDHHGIQKSDGGADFHFEAGWSPQGAVCVAHTRVAENIDLEALAARCPRLRAALGNECTEPRAQALGAQVFNRSR
ncbi:MAG: ADYC domain-containing protein [Dokdonella sp.]